MSTSDQQEQGPLTRKQLREIRLTGSTPVITPEEAAAAAAAPTVPPVPPLPRAAEPVELAPAPTHDSAAESEQDTATAHAPLTRRQVRERSRTASVPVVDGDQPSPSSDAADHDAAETVVDEVPNEDVQAEDGAVDEVAVEQDAVVDDSPVVEDSSSVLVTAVPAFAPATPADDIDDADDEIEAEILAAPVSASSSVDSAGEVPLAPGAFVPVSEGSDSATEVETDDDAVAAVAELGIEVEAPEEHVVDPDDVLADVDDDADDSVITEGERPTVNPAFGQGVLSDAPEPQKPFAPSFDELLTVGDSTGSQHLAPNTLIFTPSAGDGSLSGPVASTGEILVTGSYELPKGLGSQGHAHGTTDGKDVDAVLIDGELPPASSPTPIAASAAVSTIKPAGEVIRPPAPEKGNKLMLILAIVAGGLALALGVSLIVAFNSNVF